ncbi:MULTISPECIES: TetR/AcrR family transcriptional regulator [unclassified Streptomyces]|uniref:TetR/AcrR family transcriptional regulator n=1 Tax=unclassified Streptomyces TaxID=2593676 RepID=UPI002DDAFB2A|nr:MULTISPECIES: TetR/AcrR family transcriptional regulator [unclassified Streptomyces]WSA93021.1 TetR/AcrR family transcriptional regulator [Streptomyces sp. NBC_01795]WSB77391.1 TetR/AcrR family transcriptional regulator [Streptomyces sp. NBC_01775]WSS14343.1 TetR/AcrR family transcriptional regulator [Streptomyces sp. NBC_01186]WSS43161.1 TetR/AcrR family transcriptional regulator [Streptomyces sp. NBC_01187]
MGHREDLLEGAKRCLLEKGYARTTARDIVQASGTNLASIGYHYGSKDALLQEALFAWMGEWMDDVEAIVKRRARPEASRAERFTAGWTAVSQLLGQHRHMWTASIELILQSYDNKEMREQFTKALPEARSGLVALLNGVPEEEVTQEERDTFGRLYYLLMVGLVMEGTLDPDTEVPGSMLVEAMRGISGG